MTVTLQIIRYNLYSERGNQYLYLGYQVVKLGHDGISFGGAMLGPKCVDDGTDVKQDRFDVPQGHWPV